MESDTVVQPTEGQNVARNTRVASLSTGLCHSDVASAVSFGVQYGSFKMRRQSGLLLLGTIGTTAGRIEVHVEMRHNENVYCVPVVEK
jgi:hypothetical protein